jgi:hypothetical protein
MKNCIDCKHFYMFSAEPGYSDMTPGTDMSIGCSKDKWRFRPMDDTECSFRDKMHTAKKCEHYEYEKA